MDTVPGNGQFRPREPIKQLPTTITKKYVDDRPYEGSLTQDIPPPSQNGPFSIFPKQPFRGDSENRPSSSGENIKPAGERSK